MIQHTSSPRRDELLSITQVVMALRMKTIQERLLMRYVSRQGFATSQAFSSVQRSLPSHERV